MVPARRVGSSIGLIAIGLILTFAVRIDPRRTDLMLVGWILAARGTVGLVVTLVLARQQRPVVAPQCPDPRDPRQDPRY